MVNISTFGDSAIKFTFTDSDHYLYGDGEITVPVNSLLLVVDESDMVTFKKPDGDSFISFNISNSNFASKAALEAFYKENMTGGGGGSIDSGAVQTMIDASISGMADNASYDSVSQEIKFYNGNTEVYSVDASDFVIDGMIDDVRIETISGVTYLVIDFNTASGKEDIQIPLTDIFDPSNYYTKQEVDASLSGKQDTLIEGIGINIDDNVISVENPSVYLTQAEYDALVSGGTVDPDTYYVISDATAIDINQYYTSAQTNSAINAAVSGKADASAVYTKSEVDNAISAATDGKADASAVTASIEAATSGKVDSSSVVTAVTSGSTDSEIPTAKAVFDAIPTGGEKAVVGGRGITVTSGETADTVSFNLPISAGTNAVCIVQGTTCEASGPDGNFAGGWSSKATGGYGSFAYGNQAKATNYSSVAFNALTEANGQVSSAFGLRTKANGDGSFSQGNETSATSRYSHAEGNRTITKNDYEHASGQYNVSSSASTTFGNSGNTLFSVGNGTANNARHNAFEIRQNGDIYISSGGTDIKLQDNLGSSIEISSAITSGDTNPVQGGAIYDKFDEVEEVTAAGLNALNDRVSEDEEVTAAGLNALNDKLGGLKLVKLTQSAYDALSPNYDSNTLYVIVN